MSSYKEEEENQGDGATPFSLPQHCTLPAQETPNGFLTYATIHTIHLQDGQARRELRAAYGIVRLKTILARTIPLAVLFLIAVLTILVMRLLNP